jgi:hypothetical protein
MKSKIQNLLSTYQERLDGSYLDGERLTEEGGIE